jgi:hypothetical protein
MGGMKPRGLGRVHPAWVMLGATGVVLLAASGIRSGFGVFIKPMETEFGWDRTALWLVASLSFQSAAFVAFAATPMVLAISERPLSRRPPAMVAVAPAAGG